MNKNFLTEWKKFILNEAAKPALLKLGMKEKDKNGPIHQIQTLLKNLKSPSGKPFYAGEVDGDYGRGTKTAVSDFQKAQIDAGNLPAKNKRGRSNADGIVGPSTKSLLTQASATDNNIGKPAPSPAAKKAKPQSKKAAMTNAIAARLQSDLSGYVNEDEMKNVVKILKVADKMGILSAVSHKYFSLTGDGLQATIRGVVGVAGPKNQALALLGGKAAKDYTTQVVDGMKESWENLNKKLRGSVPPGKLLGLPLNLRAMTNFIMLRTSTMTEKELTNKDRQLMTQFLTYLQTVGGKNAKRGAKTFATHYNDYGKFMKAQGNFENVHGHLDKKTLSTLDKILTKVYPSNVVNHLQLTLGQASVIDKGDHYLVVDNYDYNKIEMMPDEYKSWDQLPDSISKNIDRILTGSGLTAGVENILSWYHKAGYPGYPVRWKIPKATAVAKVPGTRIDRKGRRRKA